MNIQHDTQKGLEDRHYRLYLRVEQLDCRDNAERRID
jgi:hypothetical protein